VQANIQTQIPIVRQDTRNLQRAPLQCPFLRGELALLMRRSSWRCLAGKRRKRLRIRLQRVPETASCVSLVQTRDAAVRDSAYVAALLS
jgi:hypothetical protein